MIDIDLKGKTILVTGASNGIGKEAAEFLMKMGAKVAVHFNSNKKAAEALISSYSHTGSKTFQADISIEENIYTLFDGVCYEFGKIDVIILNAGVFLPHSTQENAKDWFSVWKKTMDINLNSVGLLTKFGIDHFIKNGEGRFIYVASRAAFRGETEEYLAYAASKGGMVSLARSVARSFGKQNIKSFIIAPGFTRTQMAENFIASHGEQKVLDEIALNELTKPKDLTPLIGLMCAGLIDHATGSTIDINAGSHIR